MFVINLTISSRKWDLRDLLTPFKMDETKSGKTNKRFEPILFDLLGSSSWNDGLQDVSVNSNNSKRMCVCVRKVVRKQQIIVHKKTKIKLKKKSMKRNIKKNILLELSRSKPFRKRILDKEKNALI